MILFIRAALVALAALLPAAPARAEIAVPTSTLTRPANTTAYAQNDLIASSTTAGSIVVPSLTITFGEYVVGRLRLATNVTTGWDGATLRVRLWTAAPTYTNGDNGAYAVATGAASYLGACDVTLAQDADGARGDCAPTVGAAFAGRGTKIYWDLQQTSAAALTPVSGQTFTLIAEVLK